MSRKKRKIYKGYFDIAHMIDDAKANHIAFVIAVSADKERGAGKTYSTAKYLMSKYKESGERFAILVREVKELGKAAEGIFGVMCGNEYDGMQVFEKKVDNVFSTVYCQSGTGKDKKTEICGYVLPLKNAGNIKNYRGILEHANVKYFYMDEFMTLDNKYLTDETTLLKRIYDTVNGKIEDLPIIMTANCLTLGNPYFSMLRLNGRIQSNTRSLKTESVIYENVEVEGLAERHMQSAINRAYGLTDERYTSNTWINDSNSLVCKPDDWGRPIYICGLKYDDKIYGVYAYPNVGLYYVTNTYDATCPYVYSLTLNGAINIPVLRNNRTVCNIKEWLYDGVLRTSSGQIQRMLLDIFQ